MLNVGKYRNKSKCNYLFCFYNAEEKPRPLSTLSESPFSNRAAYLHHSFVQLKPKTIYTKVKINRQFGREEGMGGVILSNF